MGPLSPAAPNGLLPTTADNGADTTSMAPANSDGTAFAQVLAALADGSAADAVSALASPLTTDTTESGAEKPTEKTGDETDAALVAITAQLNAVATNVGHVLHKAGAGSGSTTAGDITPTTLPTALAMEASAQNQSGTDSKHSATPAPGVQQRGALDQLLGVLATLAEQQNAEPSSLSATPNAETDVTPVAEAHADETASAQTTQGQTDITNAVAGTGLGEAGTAHPGPRHPNDAGPRVLDVAVRSTRVEQSSSPDLTPTASLDAARSVWGKVDLARAARSVEASVALGGQELSVTARHVRGGIEIAIDAPAVIAANLNGFERDQLKRELADAGVNVRDVHVEERQEQPGQRRKQNDTSEGEHDA